MWVTVTRTESFPSSLYRCVPCTAKVPDCAVVATVPVLVVPSPQLIVAAKLAALSVPLLSVMVATCTAVDGLPTGLPSWALNVTGLTLQEVPDRSDRGSNDSMRPASRDAWADRRRWRRWSRELTPFGVRNTVETLKSLKMVGEGYSK